LAWGLITFLIGLAYGALSPGRTNKSRLFLTGLLIGVILAVVFTLLGGVQGLPLGTGMLAIILGVALLSLLFVLGAWIGDLLEGAFRRRRSTP